jgi:hypothetical protein
MTRGWHVGRSFGGPGPLEADAKCSCEKAPCGLVVSDAIDPACPSHAGGRAHTIRTSHQAVLCPARPDAKGH